MSRLADDQSTASLDNQVLAPLNFFANFIAKNVSQNSLFKNKSRDNCNYPFWHLRESFKFKGIDLNTEDVNIGRQVLFELHINAEGRVRSAIPAYLFIWESAAIIPKNESKQLTNKYRKIFTWNDDLVDNNQYLKFQLPVTVPQSQFINFGWKDRELFSCIIASNKVIAKKNSLELYTKRIETIRWFENNASNDFDLYGIGWDYLLKDPGVYGKLSSRLRAYLSYKKPYPSYRGEVESKHETLMHYKFSFCYENMGGLSGYITEKIFDCFFSGCVPVYWGASNISEYIPQDCYIDRLKFKNHESLYKFLKSMQEDEYISYQESIKKFLTSEKAKKFYVQNFSSTVISAVENDLKKLS